MARERLLQIRERFGSRVRRLVVVELDGEALRMIIYLEDGTNLRVTEQWRGETLERYSYYWLSPSNALKIGWDNAPHHTQLESFPHHKHIGCQAHLAPSQETCLEEVMRGILAEIDKGT
ncbi:MAG: toxin-antitoxin system TumE family protein [Chloroflexota bacterium]